MRKVSRGQTMKVLFTTPILEYPPAGGPQLRIANSIKALSKVTDLHVVCRAEQRRIGGAQGLAYFEPYCQNFVFSSKVAGLSPYKWVRRAQKIIKGVLCDEADFLIQYAHQHQCRVIWFGFGNISFPLIKVIKQKAPHLVCICDTDSVWSRFILRELPFETHPKRAKALKIKGAQKAQEEKEWVELCEVTTAVSQVDAQYYQSLTQKPHRIFPFSNVLDLKDYAQKVPRPPAFKSPSMYLAGSFGHPLSSMNRAAKWVLEEILPRVKQRLPNIHFYILGNYSKESFNAINDPCVSVLGKVDSVLPYLQNASVALVPLLFESGTRFKILEAGACGVPMVSTTLGAEGLPVKHNENIVIADDAQAFSDGICTLILNNTFAQGIAKGGQKMVQSQFSVEALAQEAEAILDFVGECCD